jgi:aldehyde dehydrogenase (NAD+)
MTEARSSPPEWPIAQRVRWLRAFRRRVAARRDDLVALCVKEVHKTPWEALTADVLPLVSSIKWHEGHARRLLRVRTIPGTPWWATGQAHRVEHRPLGTVGVIATWNYPVQLLGIQVVQALAAGNRVVVKPSERSPKTQELLLSLAHEAGLPDGGLQWTDASREAGARMLRERKLDHLVFTGSTAVGREIARWAADSLTPTTLELSGRDSAFVLADADPVLAARSIWGAATVNGGQTCMAPRRALVDRSVYSEFVFALAALAAGARPRRLIDDSAARRVFDLSREACAQGGRSLSGVLEPPKGDALTPLAIVDCPQDAPLVAGDHFGPALAVVQVDSADHAIEIHRRCDQHLATSVFTRSRAAAQDVVARIATTTVTVNDCLVPTGHPGSSISGRGLSGWGESRGVDGLLALTRPVHVSNTPRLRPSIFAPPPRKAAQFDGLISWFYGRKDPPGPRAGESGPPHAAIPHTNDRATADRAGTLSASASTPPNAPASRP